MVESPEPSSQPIIAAYGHAIASALDQRGVDSTGIFAQAGVELSTTTDPMQRLGNAEVARLFELSVEATGDPAFGLFVAECLHPGNFHALGYALMSSDSLRDFCLRLENYYHVVSMNAGIHIHESDGEFRLVVDVLSPDVCFETQDAFTALMVRMMRFIYRPDFNPLRVELIRPVPVCGAEPYEDCFGHELRFGCPRLTIALDAGLVDRTLTGASKELAQMHDQTAMQYLMKLEKEDIVNRARVAIVEGLSSGVVSKKWVADKLNMSPRNLQLKLAAKDQTFQRVLDETRHSLALGYIEQSSVAITEIAYLLGFTDVSNFTRAFRRWTGKSPRGFRQTLGSS